MEERQYEAVYLKADDSVAAAKAHLNTHRRFYTECRNHRALEDTTPDAAYFAALAAQVRPAA